MAVELGNGNDDSPASKSVSKPAKKLFSVTVERFHTILEGVVLPMGLRVARIAAEGTQATIQAKPLDGSLTEPASVEVVVSREDLEAFLIHKSPGGLKDFMVTLENGAVHVTATLHVLIDMRASAVCRLEIENGTRLVAVLETAGVLGVTAKNLIQSQIDSLNPLFETSMLPIPCELRSVEIENGWIRVRGSITSLQ